MPKLHVTNGALEGTMFHLLEKRITVGRTEENLIRINDSTVSKYHAVIRWDGNGYKILDLGSTNGTRLNGEPISEAKLTSGDTVAFGDVELRYEAPVGKPAHAPTPVASRPIAATSPPVAAPGAATPPPTISTPPTLAPSTGRGRLHLGIRSPTAPGQPSPPDSPYAPPPIAVRNPCKNHPHVSAVDRCAGCAEAFCGDCLVEVHGQKYCGACKIMALKGRRLVEEATEPCEEAGKALTYAIIGIFCLGMILGCMAISKAAEAKKLMKENPRLTGSGKATAALIIGIIDVLGWLMGFVLPKIM